MEIERKYLIKTLPDLKDYEMIHIKQGYISTTPVIRIRQKNEAYILTCKGKGLIAREEFELQITKEEYEHLATKTDYPMIEKRRYLIPYNNHTVELDIFDGMLSGLTLAEVEFASMEDANRFMPPLWFGRDVSSDARYQNNQLTTRESLGDLPLV